MKIFLRGVISALSSSGLEAAKVEDIIEQCNVICHVEGNKKPNWTVWIKSANWLECMSIINTNDLKNGIHTLGSSSIFKLFNSMNFRKLFCDFSGGATGYILTQINIRYDFGVHSKMSHTCNGFFKCSNYF